MAVLVSWHVLFGKGICEHVPVNFYGVFGMIFWDKPDLPLSPQGEYLIDVVLKRSYNMRGKVSKRWGVSL